MIDVGNNAEIPDTLLYVHLYFQYTSFIHWRCAAFGGIGTAGKIVNADNLNGVAGFLRRLERCPALLVIIRKVGYQTGKALLPHVRLARPKEIGRASCRERV